MPESQPGLPQNEGKEIDLLELARKMWGQRRRVLKYMGVGLIAGLIIAFSTPKTYRVSTKLAPENSAAAGGRGALAGLSAIAGVNLNAGAAADGLTAAVYPDIVRSTPFLLEFADIPVTLTAKRGSEPVHMTLFEYLTEHQRYPWWTYIRAVPGKTIGWITGGGTEDVPVWNSSMDILYLPPHYKAFIGTLNQLISVEQDKKSSLLEASVTMQDPMVAALVADSLVSKLERYMYLYQTSKTRHDLEQSLKQNEEAKAQYYEAEDRLAQALDQNRQISTQALQTRIRRLENERQLTFSVYNQTATQVEINKVKLQEETPVVTVIEPAIVPHQAVAPRKAFILVACTMLAAFIAVGVVVLQEIFGKKEVSGPAPYVYAPEETL